MSALALMILTTTTASWATGSNRVSAPNMFLQVTDNLTAGFEVAFWRTSYRNETLAEPDPADRIAFPTEQGTATVYQWTVQYNF